MPADQEKEQRAPAAAGSAGPPLPSEWLLRWAHRLPGGAEVLDLACGRGRHARWLAARGHPVLAVDSDDAALAALADLAPRVRTLAADLEQGDWPLAGRTFDAVIVFNYLWRPRLPELLACVRPGGWLVWETFAAAQATIGRPSRPEFLLQPGELQQRLLSHAGAAPSWQVIAFEDRFLPDPDRFVQRIVGQRLAPG